VANLVELDLAQLRALPHHEQITQHFCIHAWSGVAKWGGVSMQTIVDLVEPHPEAKWVIFYSLRGADKGVYYDAHPIEHMSHQHRRRCPIISAGFTNQEYVGGADRRRPCFCSGPGGAQSSSRGFMAGWVG